MNNNENITVAFSKQEIDLINKECIELGFDKDAYFKYCCLLGIFQDNTYDINSLWNKMLDVLKDMKSKKKFIVSALLPDEWVYLKPQQKRILVQRLSRYIKNNPKLYICRHKAIRRNINQYEKK